jgi:membrane glycosyltransferase
MTPIQYFGSLPSLFPQWPVSYQLRALSLFAFTMCLLFLPKFLALSLIAKDQDLVRQSGSSLKLTLSVMLESLLSVLMAPIRMVGHSRFVVQTLLGARSQWGAQQRTDYQLGWRDALVYHGVDTLIGIAWGVLVYQLAPGFFWWLIPVLTGLVLAVPTAALTSRKDLGVRSKRWGLFLIPEETLSPPILKGLVDHSERTPEVGFMRAVADPLVNALHLRLLKRESGYAQRPWVEREQLVKKFLEKGIESLSNREKFGLLSDANAMTQLHLQVGAGKHSAS